jgi:hypothetical protein
MGVRIYSLALREEHKMRISEERSLRRIFRSKREEMATG